MSPMDPLDKIRFDSAQGFVSPHWLPMPQQAVLNNSYANMRDWGNAYGGQLPQQLGGNTNASALQQILQNLQLSGQLQQINQGNVSVRAGGGRMGYGFPTDDGYVSVGALMGGRSARGNTPDGPVRDSSFKAQGADASYSNAYGTFGMNYLRQPEGNQYNLFYRREF